MKDQIKVVVNSEEGVVSEVLLVNGETAALQVQENVSYEFQSVTEGVAPDELLVKRNGDNLEVYADASSATPLVTIEGYYLLAAPVPLVGMAENGEYFSFVPQTGVAAELPWNLADGASSYQGLGYGAVGSPVPWWPILLAGVLLLGGAAVAASSSSSSSKGAAIIDPTDEDSVFATAQGKVDDAKAAVAAAEQELADAISDGKVTADEVADLNAAIQDAQDKLDAAEDAINNLPDSGKKTELENELAAEQEKLDLVEAEAAVKAAEQAVQEAQDAYQAAKDAIVEAEKDGEITQEEYDALVQAVVDAEAAKSDAQDKVDELPGDAVGDLQDRIDALTEPTVGDLPAVGETDAAKDAREAVEAAEDAYQAAKDAVTEAEKDGEITQEEYDALVQAVVDAEAAKSDAQNKVDELPGDAVGDLQDRIDALTEITVPAEGKTDAYNTAEQAVEEAEAAYQDALEAITTAEADGEVTPQERTDLLNDVAAAAQLKQDAQDLVNGLPVEAQSGLQGRLEGLTEITVPEVDTKPTVSDQPYDLGSINEGGDITLNKADLLAGVGAADVDDDILSVVNVQVDSSLGVITDNGNGTWTFTPTDYFSHNAAEGKLTITFDVTDGKTAVNASASLHVEAVADGVTIELKDDIFDNSGTGGAAGPVDLPTPPPSTGLIFREYKGLEVDNQSTFKSEGLEELMHGKTASSSGRANTFTGDFEKVGSTIVNGVARSEERRVGKECRSRWAREQ